MAQRLLLAEDISRRFKMAEQKSQNTQDEENLLNLQWMIRPCDIYEDEYSDCTSIKARFHQYFIHGKTTDCNAWKTDHTNCKKWFEEQNEKAFKELLASEQKRRVDRLTPHFQNDTWKKRTHPPPDWDKALPAWLEEENKNTLLGLKSEEMRTKGKLADGERSLCVIS